MQGKRRYPILIARAGWREFEDMANYWLLSLAHRDKLRDPIDSRSAQALIE
jgi:hypothetical protein